MGVVFPLITFPYVSRVLGPEGLGKVDYSQATVTYFVLIASFGISGYAVREGARLRDDRLRLNTFCADMLAINLVTVCIAYAAFLLSLLIPKFAPYRGLMLLFSVSIILTVISLEWLYNIFEEYRYITTRSFVFQLLSLVLLFILVRTEEDYVWYAVILVLSGVGSNVLNFIRARKYIDIRLHFHRGLLEHVRPMFLIFIMNIASSVYLIMDRSMLGYITGDVRQVGLYAAAIKIHVVVMSFLTSLRVIMTPRVAYQLQHDSAEADRLNNATVRLAVLFAMPCAVGIMLLSGRILLLLSGNSFADAGITLRILMVDLVFAALNGIMVNQIFITRRMDRYASGAVVLGALINLVSNSLTIPLWGKEGAAVSTVISEAAMFVFVILAGRKLLSLKELFIQILQSAAACVPMGLGVWIVSHLELPNVLSIVCSVAAGAVGYFAVMLVFRNSLVTAGAAQIKKRLKKR